MEYSVTKTNKISLVEDNDEFEDPFKRLPDLLIVTHIFEKICEAKSLCRCSMVSKHFSSLVFQVKSVSIKIPRVHILHQLLNPTTNRHPISLPKKLLKLIITPLRFLILGLFRCIPMQRSQPLSASWYLEHYNLMHMIARFLGRFTSLRSLNVEIDYSGLYNFCIVDALVKWKYDFKSSNFIFLVARSLDSATADVDVGGNDDINVIADDQFEFFETRFGYYLEDALSFWYPLMENLLPLLPESLQVVVVTDSTKQGRVDIGEKAILETRNSNTGLRNPDLKMRIWHAPVIQLPFSGSVLKGITLFIGTNNANDNHNDYLVVKEAFDGEEKIYAEAALEMLKKGQII